MTFNQFVIKFAGTYTLYLVHIRKAQFFDLQYQLKSHKTLGLEGQLGIIFKRNLKFIMKFLQLGVYLCQIAFILAIIVASILLIYQQENWFYTISLIIWFSPSILLIKSCGSTIFFVFFFLYMSVLYIQMRFRQLFYRLKTESSFNLGNNCK